MVLDIGRMINQKSELFSITFWLIESNSMNSETFSFLRSSLKSSYSVAKLAIPFAVLATLVQLLPDDVPAAEMMKRKEQPKTSAEKKV
jgi:hypothetical protein